MFWDKFCDVVDRINRWTGNILAWGTVVMLLIMLFEVISRYVFDSPTTWAWKLNTQIFSGTMILGGGYVLLNKGHVKLDILYERVGPGKKRLFDMITFPLFVILFVIVLWQGWKMMINSVSMGEHDIGLFRPPLYYGKIAFIIGSALIFLEGLSGFIRKLKHTQTHEETMEELVAKDYAEELKSDVNGEAKK
jgi:TRAP-type mannitol/chloroaromatic compound transport system permease small subunit